jgi:hypothetical protein
LKIAEKEKMRTITTYTEGDESLHRIIKRVHYFNQGYRGHGNELDSEDMKYLEKFLNSFQDKLSRRNMQIKDLKTRCKEYATKLQDYYEHPIIAPNGKLEGMCLYIKGLLRLSR